MTKFRIFGIGNKVLCERKRMGYNGYIKRRAF
jgi:hypothetical protein